MAADGVADEARDTDGCGTARMGRGARLRVERVERVHQWVEAVKVEIRIPERATSAAARRTHVRLAARGRRVLTNKMDRKHTKPQFYYKLH
jgi:hypothetical protein